MRLRDLDPEFVKYIDTGRRKFGGLDMADADGIFFACPKCFKDNGGQRPGVHGVLCWRPHVPAEASPGPGRWEFQGTGFDDLTLVAGSSSVYLTGPGCGAHFFIRSGQIDLV